MCGPLEFCCMKKKWVTGYKVIIEGTRILVDEFPSTCPEWLKEIGKRCFLYNPEQKDQTLQKFMLNLQDFARNKFG